MIIVMTSPRFIEREMSVNQAAILVLGDDAGETKPHAFVALTVT